MSMEKVMHDYLNGIPITAFFLGTVLAYLNVIPDGMLYKVLTLLLSGAVTGVAGLITSRITRNILKRIHKRRLLPSILKGEDDE